MLPRLLVALSVVAALLPTALAGPPDCSAPETMCLGGNQSMEGAGTCPGGSERYHFILGYEGTRTGSYVLAGAGTMCEQDEIREGVFVIGAPVPVFAGVYENDEHCGIRAGAMLYVSYEQVQRDDAITCMLM